MYEFLQRLGKKPSAKIPLEERLRALAEHRITGRDLRGITNELYTRYGLTPPVHPAQAFSATAARVRRLVEEGDAETIALCERIEQEFSDAEPAVPADAGQSEDDE